MLALRATAARLADDYFDAVFIEAKKEFEVHAETRRSLRRWTVEQGLRVWLPSAARDTVWLPARRRSLHGSAWMTVDTVVRVEQEARRVLGDWAGSER